MSVVYKWKHEEVINHKARIAREKGEKEERRNDLHRYSMLEFVFDGISLDFRRGFFQIFIFILFHFECLCNGSE